MMQLALYDNDTLILDLTTRVIDNDIEFSTFKHGFGYLTIKSNLLLFEIINLQQTKKIYHVRLGTGSRIFWEGRLEDIEIQNNPTLTAFGYWRSFTDLQVTDLWSTTNYSKWKPSQRNTSVSLAYDDKAYNFSTEKELFIGVKNNVSYGNAPSVNGGFEYYLPSGYLRGFQCISYLSSGVVTNSFSYGTFTRDLPGVGAYNVVAVNINTPITTTVFHPNKPFAGLYYARSAANALFVGEDNSQYVRITNLRIGTTPSISGGRLYADEVLRFYASGVYSLNPSQISPIFSNIQSPMYDITDLEFRDSTGLDVIAELLKYPSISGQFWRIQVWDNKRIYFEPKVARNTWYARFSDVSIKRTADTVYTQDRIRYTTLADIDVTTPYYRLQNFGIERQSVTPLDNVSISQIQQAKINDAQKKERIEIECVFLQDTQGAFKPAYEARAGDQIIFIDLPAYVINIVDRSFLIEETVTTMKDGITRIIPEQKLAEFDTLMTKVTL